MQQARPALRRSLHLAAAALSLTALGCDAQDASNARRQIRETHMTEVRDIVAEDLSRHRQGVEKAAAKLAPGFVREDPAVREREVRAALRLLQEPPRGIPEFIASPMSFLAAVGADGVVIARDADPDAMKGMDFGEMFPVVRRALSEGRAGFALGEFATDEESESSWSMLFVAPSRREGRVVGAVVAGIPLWRMAQRLSNQLRVERAPQIEQGLVLWVYLYKGDRIFHFGTPPELEDLVPNASARATGLAGSAGGFTGQGQKLGKVYGFGVMPLPRIGDDVGVIVLRGDPPE